MAKKNRETPDLPRSGTPRPAPRRRSQPTPPLSAARDGEPHSDPSHSEIAEAAYHRYLSRGAVDGRDFDDWMEAERELREQHERRSGR